MTGVASFYGELGGKRLGLLCEAVPHALTFAFLSPRRFKSEVQQCSIDDMAE